jgi:hypothetical protein
METQSVERRKQELITEGFGYRGQVRSATVHVKHGLHPEVLSHGAVGMIAKTALGLVAGRAALGGIGVKTLLPLAMSAFSMLRQTGFKPSSLIPAMHMPKIRMPRVRMPSVSKPVMIKGGLAAGGIGALAAIAVYLIRKRRTSADL